MTEAAPKRGRGRPRKHPEQASQKAPAAPQAASVAALAPAQPAVGLSALTAPPAPQAPPLAAPVAVDPVQRPEQRPESPRMAEVRAEDPRAEAERIANEWFGHLDSLGPQRDKYHIDPHKFPDGWTYEWKTFTVVGKENPQYQVQLARAAWRAVPVIRHPELMPGGWDPNSAIIIDGMMLMERPSKITEFQKMQDQRAAKAPIDNIRAKLAGAPPGQLPRDADPRTAPKINTTYGAPDLAAKVG